MAHFVNYQQNNIIYLCKALFFFSNIVNLKKKLTFISISVIFSELQKFETQNKQKNK